MTEGDRVAGFDAGLCTTARWVKHREGQTEYGIAGLSACAVIAVDTDGPFSCHYHVDCAAHRKSYRGRKSTEVDATDEVIYWLKHLDCPGLSKS